MRRRPRRKSKSNATTLNFDKSQFVEKELQDKISLWMLRIIINLGGHREFIDKDNYFQRDEVAYFLGLESNPDQTRDEVLEQLTNNLEKIESKKSFTTSKTLANNIKNISKLLNLDKYEQQILEFVVLLEQYEILDDCVQLSQTYASLGDVQKLL